jgi:hypothetical protein
VTQVAFGGRGRSNDVKFDMVETVDKNQVASAISTQVGQQVGRKPDAVTAPTT